MAEPRHDPAAPASGPSDRAVNPTLARKLRLAGLSIAWERIWPRLLPPMLVAALFLAAAWLRLFQAMPDGLRLFVVGLVALVFLASLVPLFRIRLPSGRDRVGRLERDSALEHQPLVALSDRQAGAGDDPLSRAMWAAHQRRAAAALAALTVRGPSPRVDRLDPFALRAAVLLVFAIGLVAGRGDLVSPVVDAVRLPSTPPPDVRIDAWVTPPAYTNRAPIFLTDRGPAGGAPAAPAAPVAERSTAEAAPVLTVPAGTVFSMRVSGLALPEVVFVPEGGTQEAVAGSAAGIASASAGPDGPIRPTAFEFRLDRAGVVVLGESEGGDVRRFAFAVDPDRAPVVRLTEDPARTARGAFRLAYSVEDDYRVAGARAVFAEPRTALDSGIGPSADAPRPLIGPPEMPLALPRRTAENKAAETFRDLSAHPWAGAVVAMTLEARDDAGNLGRSDPIDVVIPARPFRDPVARMLVEQRRLLALDAGRAPAVVEAFDTVAYYAPEFMENLSVFLGLRVVRNRIAHARDDEDLRETLDLMWEMALAIDGGDASLAEQRLREARERLRDALQNGASQEEIARLTEELRQAMQEYMQALAEQMRNNPNLAQPSPQQMQSMQQLSQQDLQEMVDRIEELSRLGDREAAEQLLSQLDQMLENMMMAQPQMQPSPNGEQSPQQQMMNELADMIRRQQELMNETHRMTPDGQQSQQQNQQPGQNGEAGEEQRQQAMRQLQQQQQDLQKQLEQLMQQMQENGMQPGDQLGQAQQEMQGAQGSLGEGQSEQALGQQGEALQAMREGAQQMAEQMAQQQGEGQGQGQGRQAGQQNAGEDPLGRPQRRKGPDFGDSVRVPGEIEVQRARRILEELRRRFSDQTRPAIELDYLQRLLNPF